MSDPDEYDGTAPLISGAVITLILLALGFLAMALEASNESACIEAYGPDWTVTGGGYESFKCRGPSGELRELP